MTEPAKEMGEGRGFDGADFYDCDEDAERLEHWGPLDALDSYLSNMDPGDDIAEACPIRVYAWRRQQVPMLWLSKVAKNAAERVIEDIDDDEYGDPDGDHCCLDAKGCARLEQEFTTAVQRAFRDHAQVWACERMAHRDYSLEEIRAEWPELFEAQP